MANENKALPENTPGNFFVDSSCINCGVSRYYAAEVFGDSGTHAFVKKQPENAQERLATQQALLACPTGSIGMRQKHDLKTVIESFPIAMTDEVFLNGFNHKNSFGAHSYFIQSETGNWLIDSPRFTPHLVNKFEQMGGLSYIFLTHRDDVADAHRYAQHFGAQRIIHQLDADAQKEAELILEGDEITHVDAAEIHFTPGHTRGHMVLLWKSKYLFTGDHFAWIPRLNRFASFRTACWYSWEVQIESVRKMQVFKEVEWVFPGHGKWGQVDQRQFPQIIEDAVEWMLEAR